MDRFNAISEEFAEPMDDDQDERRCWPSRRSCRRRSTRRTGGTWTGRIEIALDALRCPPPDANVERLSGGERRRVALCRLLLEKPDLLLLDEPTNHLDAESVAWLEKTLRDFAGTVMIITHDRYFLDNVTNWILEIERGRGYPFEGNYSSWLAQKRKRLQQEEKEESARQRALAAEEEWIQSQPRGRGRPRAGRASPSMRRCCSRARTRWAGVAEIVIPPGSAAGWAGDRGGEAAEGVREPAADRRPGLQAAAGRDRGRDRAERGGQDDAVPDDHRAGRAGWRRACAWARR